MSIKKTYYFQLHHDNGEIEDIVRKGKSFPTVVDVTVNEFPDLHVSACGLRRRLVIEERRCSVLGELIFRSGSVRGGQYTYQHKGRKKRGRKNRPTPQRKWTSVTRSRLTFIEHRSSSISDFLKGWIAFIHEDQKPIICKPQPIFREEYGTCLATTE